MSVATSKDRSISKDVDEATTRETVVQRRKMVSNCDYDSYARGWSRSGCTCVYCTSSQRLSMLTRMLLTSVELLSIRVDGLDLKLCVEQDCFCHLDRGPVAPAARRAVKQ